MIPDLSKAKDTIAEDIHRCWYEWNKGDGEYFKGDGTFCHVCGIYAFNEKGKEVDGFVQYLNTQSIKVKYPGDNTGMTYINYLAPYKSAPNAPSTAGSITTTDVLNTSKTYATIFIYSSDKSWLTKFFEGNGRLGTIAAGGAVVLIAGAAVMTSAVSVPIAIIAAGAGSGTVVTGIIGGNDFKYAAMIRFTEYNSTELDSFNCENLAVSQVSTGK